ncbi:ribonuclease T2 [Neoconidiobolus thromboides FSU 785]|nr:ribonuclease T2 [Neoconidiobolus thromboides FSU 785]
MNFYFIIFNLFSLILADLAPSSPLQIQSKCCSKSSLSCTIEPKDTCCTPYYGLVVLALQWFPTLGPKDEFTIHGLWPDFCNGTYAPSKGCDSNRMYIESLEGFVKQEASLTEELNKYWGSYKGDNPGFWTYEWGKHGTCVTTLDPKCYGDKYQPGQEVIEYFKKVLQLRKEYDLYKVFKQSGLVPGNTYSLQQFEDALYKQYKIKAMFDCKNKKLNEIRLYYRVKGKDNYILTNSVDKSNCPKEGIEYTMKI